MTPRVHRTSKSAQTRDAAHAEQIALALMGVGDLNAGQLVDAATWERSDAPCAVGRDVILAAVSAIHPPVSITIDQVIIHGKAGTVSGRLTRDGSGTHLFCHIIRFTTAKRDDIGQLVSFEHLER
ncbi:hypothetical protein [Celeribacter marinus]|uniref:hypothetical protein n=1 Tax=Celeribacter marinus TaxID=1397108 RepID=UPI003F6CCD45